MDTQERSALIMEVDLLSSFGRIMCVKFQVDTDVLW